MRCVLWISVCGLLLCLSCANSDNPTGDPLDDAGQNEAGQNETGRDDPDGDSGEDPASADTDANTDCHFDCSGGAYCDAGEVSIRYFGPAPCDVTWEHGTCVLEVIACSEGCVADVNAVVADYEALYGRGWPERGDAPAPETLCAESALVQAGSACDDTEDCQPSLCDRLACEADVCVVPDGFVCDP